MRLYRRHLRRGRRLLRHGRHPVRRPPPEGQVTTSQLVQPLANNALTLALDTDFDGCMEVVRLLSEDKRFYLANSINPLRIEGQKTISIEIVQQDDWQTPDWVIVPSGNLGNITAIGLGFQMMRELGLINKLPRLVAAQAAAAAPLYDSYKTGFTEYRASPSAGHAGDGDPDRQPRQRSACNPPYSRSSTASSGGRPKTSFPRQQPSPTAPACSPALNRRGTRSPHEARRTERHIARRTDRRHFHRQRPQIPRLQDGPTTAKPLPEVTAKLANKPVELPGDYHAVAEAITKRAG